MVSYLLNPDSSVVADFCQRAHNAGMVGFDLETNGLDPYTCDILMAQFGIPDGTVLIFDGKVPQVLVDLLGEVVVVGHNLKFDIKFAKVHMGAWFNRVYDTMIIESVLNMGKQVRVGLEHVVSRRLGRKMNKEVRRSFVGRPKGIPFSEAQLYYAAEDIQVLFPIGQQQGEELTALSLRKIANLENRVVVVTALMELRGIGLDQDRLQALTDKIEPEMLEICERIHRNHPRRRPVHFGIFTSTRSKIESFVSALNLNSHQQNLEDLRYLGYNVESTDNYTLGLLKPHSTFARDLLDFRSKHKLLSVFLWGLPKFVNPATGRIHADYNQISLWGAGGTLTGRYSCKNPNFQQQPRLKELRECFVAPPGYRMLTADYSGQELVVAVNLSRDRTMLRFYEGVEMDYNGQRVLVTDFHGYTASEVWGYPLPEVCKVEIGGREIDPPNKDARFYAKTVNYSNLYKVGPQGLAKQLIKIEESPEGLDPEQWVNLVRQIEEATVLECEAILGEYRKRVPGLMRMINGFASEALRTYKLTDQTWGRLRYFDRSLPDWRIANQAANLPIQSSSATMMKLAMAEALDRCSQVNICGAVHDEGLFLVKEDRLEEDVPAVIDIMTEAAVRVAPGPVPYKVGYHVGPTWTK